MYFSHPNIFAVDSSSHQVVYRYQLDEILQIQFQPLSVDFGYIYLLIFLLHLSQWFLILMNLNIQEKYHLIFL